MGEANPVICKRISGRVGRILDVGQDIVADCASRARETCVEEILRHRAEAARGNYVSRKLGARAGVVGASLTSDGYSAAAGIVDWGAKFAEVAYAFQRRGNGVGFSLPYPVAISLVISEAEELVLEDGKANVSTELVELIGTLRDYGRCVFVEKWRCVEDGVAIELV
jgi:hypothetical protein